RPRNRQPRSGVATGQLTPTWFAALGGRLHGAAADVPDATVGLRARVQHGGVRTAGR
ncbi:unnamed protein product, partial [Ectocarpus sp. 12 AP-2014]